MLNLIVSLLAVGSIVIFFLLIMFGGGGGLGSGIPPQLSEAKTLFSLLASFGVSWLVISKTRRINHWARVALITIGVLAAIFIFISGMLSALFG